MSAKYLENNEDLINDIIEKLEKKDGNPLKELWGSRKDDPMTKDDLKKMRKGMIESKYLV